MELALSIPVLLLMMMSIFNLATLIADQLVAGYAVRQGVRMAALLGNGQGALTTAQVDQQVVQNVLAGATNLTFGTISEIDIYNPSAASGAYQATDPHDSYDGSGNLLTQGYPVSARDTSAPNEDSIGVRIVYQYSPPTGTYSFSVQLSEYAVMKAVPILQ